MDVMEVIDVMEDIEALERLENIPRTRRKKIYKPMFDPFTLSDDDFKKKYRLNKTTINSVVSLIGNKIQRDCRGRGVSPKLQVLIAVRCWGRREVQDDAADLHGLSQPTVSRICARVAVALAGEAKNLIKMPQTLLEEAEVIRGFHAVRNFPGVVGTIDCTHIKIKKTGGENAQYYINRKGYYSLNVQVVCDASFKIRDIVVRWRGSTHDCRIFSESTLKQKFEERRFRGRLLGDSGYPLLPYLFTPLLRPQTIQEHRYNGAHISTRNIIERCFGLWKQRFRCLLDGLTVDLKNAETVIVALAVLHNIAVEMNDALPDLEENEGNVEGVNDITENALNHAGQERPNHAGQERRAKHILSQFIRANF